MLMQLKVCTVIIMVAIIAVVVGSNDIYHWSTAIQRIWSKLAELSYGLSAANKDIKQLMKMSKCMHECVGKYTVHGDCVGCVRNSHCEGGLNKCDPDTKTCTCVAGSSNTHCQVEALFDENHWMICDATNHCGKCSSDAQCLFEYSSQSLRQFCGGDTAAPSVVIGECGFECDDSQNCIDNGHGLLSSCVNGECVP